MNRTPPAVTAIMPVRNDAENLGLAVASVLGQNYAGKIDLVMGVAPSTDDTEAVAARLAAQNPAVAVVPNVAGGTAAGLNSALRQARGEVIVRVDAHCELPSNYVATAVEVLGQTGAANVGGMQAATGSTPYESAVAVAMTSRFGVGDARFHYGGAEGPVDTVYLGVFDAVRLREVDGFDESLERNQDYELNWRLRAAGHVVWFEPTLVVRYRPRSSAAALGRQYFQYGQWKREVIRRHHRSFKVRQAIAPLTVLGVTTGLVGAALGRRWMLVAPATYVAAVVGASARSSDSPAMAARLLSVFPTMHMSWGLGFLMGPPKRAQMNTGPKRESARLERS